MTVLWNGFISMPTQCIGITILLIIVTMSAVIISVGLEEKLEAYKARDAEVVRQRLITEEARRLIAEGEAYEEKPKGHFILTDDGEIEEAPA